MNLRPPNRFPLKNVIPAFGGVAALVGSFPALHLWIHVLSGQMWDFFMDSWHRGILFWGLASGLGVLLFAAANSFAGFKRFAKFLFWLAWVQVVMTVAGCLAVNPVPDG